ncbi:MAG: competence/damage-inducible protein A [Candidatus Eremiobacteraeota bacterium]|nr:competence/damage-inducible protein A [Candidatus Eremiobacteraeota bacterium]
MPNVEILAVGSELLTPERVDTNSLWLTAQLNELGFEVTAKSIIGDHRDRLTLAFRQALASADVVISTGGLGPTEDDLTRDCAAEALGVPLDAVDSIWEDLQAKFSRLGRPIPENNRRQSLVLQGGEWLANPNGTAPGQWFFREGKVLVLLPGPPRELKPMFSNHVAERLRPLAGSNVLVRRTLKIYGLGESAMDELLAPLYGQHPGVSVTTLFTPLDLEVHLLASGATSEEGLLKVSPLEAAVREVLGLYVYGERVQSLAEVVGAQLLAAGKTLATAESITGGLVAQRVTEVAGSSGYFLGSFVTYSERLKSELLGVPEGMLAQYSAVSWPVAEAMAAGARSRTGADYALSLTGYAGPDGGTEEDPVGTVYLGLAGPKGVETKRVKFLGDRELVRSRAAQAALDWLRRALLEG